MKNIVLIGFMGTGKSAVGRRLAKELNFRFVDTDHLIEEKTGKKIAALFAEEGEGWFRERETEVVCEVARSEQLVISTGGGVALNPTHLNLLSEKGIVVWLTARPEVILSRAQRRPGERPLLKGSDPLSKIKSLLKEREPYYKRSSFFVDTSDCSIADVASQIKKGIAEIEGGNNPS